MDSYGRSIAVVAAQRNDIERVRLLYTSAEIQLSLDFRERHGYFCGPVFRTPAARHYALRNVVLDAGTMILLQDGKAIPETVCGLYPNQNADPGVVPDALIRCHDDEDFIIGYSANQLGEFNWLARTLPSIDHSLRRERAGHVRLILPQLDEWQEETLAVLGLQNCPRLLLDRDKQYLLPRAEYTDFLNGSLDFQVSLARRDTVRRLLGGIVPDNSLPRRLFVAEHGPYYGRIANGPEIERILARQGFYIVDPELHSIRDRINLFRNADMVIGPHCHQLGYVMFCRPGTILWEHMPPDFQNGVNNRFAQTMGVDYWGDLLLQQAGSRQNLAYDMVAFQHRFEDLLQRQISLLKWSYRGPPSLPECPVEPRAGAVPLDDLMMAFESLGDNCELGLVQGNGGAEPLGLLRFAGIGGPLENRLMKLVKGLEQKFEGIGDPETISVEIAGEPTHQEYMVEETMYNLRYHTRVGPADYGIETVRQREAKRLPFLRRKLLDDLAEGSKIFVWRSPFTTSRSDVERLLDVLRKIGPNKLLWAVEAKLEQMPGTIEVLDEDFVKGYIAYFAPYGDVGRYDARSWFEVCQATLNFFERSK